MVFSNINKKVEYEEKENIDNNDKNHSAATFEIELLDTDIIVAIGKPNTMYLDYKIIFFSLYLVYKDKIVSKIGLYEIESDNLDKYLDEDGDLNIEILEMPLLYSFVTSDYLVDKTTEKVTVDKEVKTPVKEEGESESETKTGVAESLRTKRERVD